MNENLLQKLEHEIDSLKKRLSELDTLSVLGFVGNDMMFHKQNLASETGLTSPHKQLLYLSGLLLTTEQREDGSLNPGEYQQIKRSIEKITHLYTDMFYPTIDELNKGLKENWIRTREVSMPVFLNYFNTTPLWYQEQIVDRINSWFMPFEDYILGQTGLPINVSIKIHEYLQLYLQEQFNRIKELHSEAKTQFEHYYDSLKDYQNITMEKAQELAQKHPAKHAIEVFLHELNGVYHIPIKSINELFSKKEIDNFLECYSMNRSQRAFRYYTESNPVEEKPIWRASKDTIFCPFLEQILNGIFNFHCRLLENSEHRESFYRHRDKVAEDKALNIFKELFQDEADYYVSIYENDKSEREHDLLVVFKQNVLICEVKASKIKEPFRDPEKAFIRIQRDFKSDNGLQKAFEQGLSLKQLIVNNVTTPLYSKKGDLLTEINTESIKKIYLIAVTVEQMGLLGCNLSMLLDKPEDEPFPWAVNLYDFENIVTCINHLSLKPEKFLNYLDERERLHEKLISWDELEICGFFLNYGSFEPLESQKLDKYLFSPDLAKIFDKVYYEKKGLEYEYEPDEKPFIMNLNEEFEHYFANDNQTKKKTSNPPTKRRSNKKFEKSRNKIRKLNKKKRKKR